MTINQQTYSMLVPFSYEDNIIATLEIPVLPNWGKTVEEPNIVEIFYTFDSEIIASLLVTSIPAVPDKVLKQGYSSAVQERYLMNEIPELANWDEHKLILHKWSHIIFVPPLNGYAQSKRHSFIKTNDNQLRLVTLAGVAKVDGTAPQPEKALKALHDLISAIKYLSDEELYYFA